MHEMYGYTLNAEVKGNEELMQIPVILHTPLSGVFSNAMVKKVGANDFIPNFYPD
jgi:two-component system chemotaxis response regulator CheV